jgi:hypothetical protein
VEGTWTCTSCGSRGILGRHESCPSCGNPRDSAAESRFDFGPSTATGASAGATVSDPSLLALARAGADWSCPFCGASNRADLPSCRSCSAPRETVPDRAPAPQPLLGGGASTPRPGRRGCLLSGCALALVFAAALVGLAIWGSRSHDYPGRVESRGWRRTVERQRFTRVEKQGWQDEIRPRAAAMPARGAGEIAGVERIRDCARTQRGTRRVADGTETVCERRTRQVECGTEEKCETRDLGNGFAEEVCDDVPRYCSEDYEDCHQETRYREEPVYGVRCRYDTWEWSAAGSFEAHGTDDAPRWPAVELDPLDRERRDEAYDVVVTYGRGSRHVLHPRTAEEYARWSAGQRVRVRATNLGRVEEVAPAAAEGDGASP